MQLSETHFQTPMAGETKLSVEDKGSLDNGDLKSGVKIKVYKFQIPKTIWFANKKSLVW